MSVSGLVKRRSFQTSLRQDTQDAGVLLLSVSPCLTRSSELQKLQEDEEDDGGAMDELEGHGMLTLYISVQPGRGDMTTWPLYEWPRCQISQDVLRLRSEGIARV